MAHAPIIDKIFTATKRRIADEIRIGKSSTVFRNMLKRRQVGRPNLSNSTADKKNVKVCSSCLSKIQRGKKHLCKESVRNENIVHIVEDTSSKSKEKIVSTHF